MVILLWFIIIYEAEPVEQQKVFTADGESCAFISSDKQNDIAVIDTPFLLNGLNNQYFCMVVIVTDEKKECILRILRLMTSLTTGFARILALQCVILM